MAVNDLTGTTWFFNSVITFPLFSDTILITFEYTDDQQTSDTADSLYFEDDTIYYDGEDPYYVNGEWTDLNVRTITITGGSDVLNSDVIAWFQANAVQQGSSSNDYTITQTLTNITSDSATITITPDTGYTLPSSITVSGATLTSYNSSTGVAVLSNMTNSVSVEAECEEITGTTYLLNAALYGNPKTGFPLGTLFNYSINFISNSMNFTSFSTNTPQDPSGYCLYYSSTLIYTPGVNNWTDEAYRTICITGGADVNNQNLLTWLQNNATQLS